MPSASNGVTHRLPIEPSDVPKARAALLVGKIVQYNHCYPWRRQVPFVAPRVNEVVRGMDEMIVVTMSLLLSMSLKSMSGGYG